MRIFIVGHSNKSFFFYENYKYFIKAQNSKLQTWKANTHACVFGPFFTKLNEVSRYGSHMVSQNKDVTNMVGVGGRE